MCEGVVLKYGSQLHVRYISSRAFKAATAMHYASKFSQTVADSVRGDSISARDMLIKTRF